MGEGDNRLGGLFGSRLSEENVLGIVYGNFGGGECPGIVGGKMFREKSGGNVRPPCRITSLYAAVMICDTLVNTQTHILRSTDRQLLTGYIISSAS